MPGFKITGPDGRSFVINGAQTHEEAAKVFDEHIRPQLGNQEPSYLEQAGSLALSAGRGIRDAYQGAEDPTAKGLDVYNPTDIEDASAFQRAKVLAGNNDEALADITRTQLGDRFIRQERSDSGIPIIVYRDKSGQEKRQVLNKPGLDYQDIDRGLSAALPFLAAGGVVGGATKGAGLGTRLLAQGLGQGATSVGQDIGASIAGSEQGIDPVKGLAATAGGVIGEGLGPAVRSFFPRRATQHLDDAGHLVGEARARATRVGLSPDDLTPDESAAFAKVVDVGGDEAQAAVGIRTGRFGIPTTRAQRSKLGSDSLLEKRLRSGSLGEEAQGVLSQFDEAQKQAIRQAAVGKPTFPSQLSARTSQTERQGIGQTLAGRPLTNPADLEPAPLGTSIKEGLGKLRGEGQAVVRQAFKGIRPVSARQESFATLGPKLAEEIGPLPIDDALTPNAARIVKDLENMAKGNSVTEGSEALGLQGRQLGLEEMRRRIGGLANAASDKTDRVASRALLKGYDKWVDDLTFDEVARGNVEDLARFRTARGLFKDMKRLWEPKSQRGKLSKAGQILEKTTDPDATAEDVMNALVGRAGPTTSPPAGSVQATQQIKKAVLGAGDKELAKRTWNDIRLAYWSKLVLDNKSNINSAQVMSNNIDAAFKNQRSLIDELFTGSEKRQFRAFSAALKDATFRDPNPSGTSTAIEGLLRTETGLGGAIKRLFRVKQASETFAKKRFWLARLYQNLAVHFPGDPLGTIKAARIREAEKLVKQFGQQATDLPKRGAGGLGGAIGAQFGSSELQPQQR